MGIEQLTEIDPEFWEEQKRIHAEAVMQHNPEHGHVEMAIFDVLLRLKYDFAHNHKYWLGADTSNPAIFNQMLDEMYDRPAMTIVQNFDRWVDPHYAHTANGVWNDKTFNIVGNNITDQKYYHDLVEIAKKDNAVITDENGKVLAYSVYIDDPKVKNQFRKRAKKHDKETPGWNILGFLEPVNARHLSAMGGSYELGTPITTYSKRTGNIRRFEDGEITYSSVPGEAEQAVPYQARMAAFLP